MRLIFIHGWSFGPEVWDTLAPLLPEWEQARVDIGYFGPQSLPQRRDDDILIGHSMGFPWGLQQWGLQQRRGWRGLIAINSFARFLQSDDGRGCVNPAELRAIQKALSRDAGACVAAFRRSVATMPPPPKANVTRLADGLNLLRDFDAATDLDGSPGALPSLVLASENDPLVPPAAAEDLAEILGGKLVLHQGGGHGLPWAAPEWCAAQISGFLTQNGF